MSTLNQVIRTYISDVEVCFLEWAKNQGIDGPAYYNELVDPMIDKAQEEFQKLHRLRATTVTTREAFNAEYKDSVVRVMNYMISQIGSGI